jgi:hypothetical protein
MWDLSDSFVTLDNPQYDLSGAGPVYTPYPINYPPNQGYKVTFRNYSLEEMVAREWGSSYKAPDHRIYVWSNGRSFDSTDMGFTGIYGPAPIAPPFVPPPILAFNDLITENGNPLVTEGGNPLVWG